MDNYLNVNGHGYDVANKKNNNYVAFIIIMEIMLKQDQKANNFIVQI